MGGGVAGSGRLRGQDIRYALLSEAARMARPQAIQQVNGARGRGRPRHECKERQGQGGMAHQNMRIRTTHSYTTSMDCEKVSSTKALSSTD